MAQQIKNPNNQEKLVERFKKEVDEAKTIDELETIREQIEESELPESRKRWFYRRKIGERKNEIAEEKEKYEAEVYHLLNRLPVDEPLKEALEGYWIIEGLEKHPPESFRRDYVPYVRDLIYWVYTNIKDEKAPVSIIDLDIRKLTTTKYIKFLRETFQGEWTRYNAKSLIKTFGYYLSRSGHAVQALGEVFHFPDPQLKVPRKKKKTGVEAVTGIPRKKDELDTLITTLRIPTPGIPRWRATMYSLLARVLVQTGLRYGHILSVWRVHDITDAREGERNIVEDKVFNKTYYIIYARDILERERERKQEAVSKRKLAADRVYISERLLDDLLEHIHDRNLDAEDYLFNMSERSVQHRGATIREATGIDDFSFYDLRSTFASALFNILGSTDKAREIVRRRGGWGRDSAIPFQHYIQMMSKSDAIETIKAYDIYVDVTEEEDVKKVLEDLPVEVSPEKYANLEKRVEELTKMVEELKKRE